MLESVNGAVVDGVVLGDQTGKVYRFAERRHRVVPHSGVITYALRAFDDKRGECLQIRLVAAEANDGQVSGGGVHRQEDLRRVFMFLQQSYFERQFSGAATKHAHVQTGVGTPILDVCQIVEALRSAHIRRLERQAFIGTNYGAISFVGIARKRYRLDDWSSGFAAHSCSPEGSVGAAGCGSETGSGSGCGDGVAVV